MGTCSALGTVAALSHIGVRFGPRSWAARLRDCVLVCVSGAVIGLCAPGSTALAHAAARPVTVARAPAHAAGSARPAPIAGEVRLAGGAQPGLSGLVSAATEKPGQPLTLTVVLRRTRQAAFERYLSAVQDRASRLYHHYLSPAAQAARFGPTRAAYAQVRAWLRAEGFAIVQGSSNRLSLSVRGTLAEAERAFDTPIRRFRASGGALYANTRAPAVPRRLARHVEAVTGLSDLAQPSAVPIDQYSCSHGVITIAPNGQAVSSCADLCSNAKAGLPQIGLLGNSLVAVIAKAFADVGWLLGQIPNTVGHALGFSLLIGDEQLYCAGVSLGAAAPGFAGWAASHFGRHAGALVRRAVDASADPPRAVAASAGPAQKIGLLEFDTYRPSDVADWLNLMQLDPSLADVLSEVNVNGGVGSPGAGESEVLVDIEAALGGTSLAPSTSVVVYDAPPSTSFVQMLQAMIGDGDTVISNSWSQCEDQTPLADAQAIDSVLASAAASGITVLNGSGDDGSTCGDGSPNTVGVPADSPNATAVGGTTPTFGPGLTYGSESWWDDQSADPPGGAGGFGVSRYFSRPAYQDGLTSSPMRSVPDLSFEADPAGGIQLCQADAGGCPDGRDFGGTSLATPLLAALVADLNAGLGSNVGNLNTALYPLAGTDAFHSAQSMGSDFAHVGLGSPDITAIGEALSGTTAGPVSPSVSDAIGVGQPQADGNDEGVVRVDLQDANGLPLGGKTVTLTPNAGSTAKVSPASATTDPTDGAAVFTVTDANPETVTFAVQDTTDGVPLTTQPTLTFVPPVATGALISANPTTVNDDGSPSDGTATISVYLQNALGRPAAGKTVTLSSAGGSAVIGPASGQAVTGSDGTATFTVTDMTAQTVAFTAVDVSDGNLPVPGTAEVTFEPSGSTPCPDALPTAASGFSLSSWASGFAFNPQALELYGVNFYACSGLDQGTYDASGNLYVPDSVSGQIYVIGPSGGTADAADALPDASFAPGQLGGLAFGKDGSLYAGLSYTNNSYSDPEVVQLDPETGATERVVATAADGLQDCPYAISVDPLSGDLFTTNNCNFGGPGLSRIHNPSSADPTVTNYSELPYSGGLASTGSAFAPDGTLYVALPGANEVVSVSATDAAQPPTVTPVATSLPYPPYGVAVASTNASGQATSLDVAGNTGGSASVGTVTRVDLTQSPPANTSTIATGNADLGLAVSGPDGCVYVGDLDQILQVSTSSGCAGTNSDQPHIALSSSGPSPAPTGSSVTFTAQLSNFSAAAGTPVTFVVSGANEQFRLVDANASGQASFALPGVDTGDDEVQAFAADAGTGAQSPSLLQRWVVGKDTSFLSLNGSQGAGPLGQPATLSANLTDISVDPATPIAGASVTLSLTGQACTATTDAAGNASCTITPSGGLGLDGVSASYAGSSAYTSSTASNVFVAGGVGLPSSMSTTSSTASSSASPSTSTSTVSTTTSTSSSSSAGVAGVHALVGPTARPASVCGAVTVDLLDVYISDGRLHLLGYANPQLAGRRVLIKSMWNKETVAHAKVAADGYFSATASPPPSSRRASNTTRYAASIGREHSPALKLSRRLYVYAVTAAGNGKVRITGQVVKPLAAPPAKILVTLRDSCQSRYVKVKTTTKLNHSTGAFTILAPAPPGDAPGAVYRLQTRVRDTTHEAKTFATASLPRVVGR